MSFLLCPLATPTILLGFLLLWMLGISPRLLHQSTATALTLDEGYLPTATPSDLECGVVPLGPPAPAQPSLQARILEWVAFPSPGDLPNPGMESGSPALQADSLPSEPPVGGLSLLPTK